MILGLAVAELLVNLRRLIHERRRVDWDALPLLWAFTVLLFLFNYWWAVVTGLDGSRGARLVMQFVPLATIPILLFLLSASVLPRRIPAEGRISMRAEWDKERGVVYTLFALNQTVVWLIVLAFRGHIVWDIADITRTGVLAVLLLVLFARSRPVEWFAVTATLLLTSMRLFTQSAG